MKSSTIEGPDRDGDGFDQFAKHLSVAGSRRGLLSLPAALLGWGALLATDERAAGKRRGGWPGGKRHGHNHPRRRHARKRRHHRKKKHGSPVTCSPQSPEGACDAGQLCVEGACLDCTVTCDDDPGACGDALQAAIDAAGTAGRGPVFVCPGRYGGNFVIGAGVEIIGAGDGDDPSSDAILDAQGGGRALTIQHSGTGAVALTGLRLTGGGLPGGGGIHNGYLRILTMTRCTVSGNRTANPGHGGGIDNQGTLTLTDCLVENNSAAGSGGGIDCGRETILTGSTQVRGNTAGDLGGGINVRSGSSLTIGADCRVTENTADDGQGGGIFRDTSSSVTLESDLIVTDNFGGNCAGVPIDNCEG